MRLLELEVCLPAICRSMHRFRWLSCLIRVGCSAIVGAIPRLVLLNLKQWVRLGWVKYDAICLQQDNATNRSADTAGNILKLRVGMGS